MASSFRLEVGALGLQIVATFACAFESAPERQLAFAGDHGDAVQAFGCRLQPCGGGRVPIQGVTCRRGIGFELRQRRRDFVELGGGGGDRLVEETLLGGGGIDASPDPPEFLCTEPEPQGPNLVADRLVTFGGIGLALQRSEAAAVLIEEVAESGDVDLGLCQPSQRPVAPAAMFGDPCRLLDDRPVILGAGPEDLTDLSLVDQDVLLAPYAAVRQQIVEVEEPARGAVEFVFGSAVAIQPAGHRDLVEVEREEPVGVVEGHGDLGPSQGGAGGGAGKDHVLHAVAAEVPRRLGPHHPGERIEQVGLARSVGSDHDTDPGRKIEARPVGKGLESRK